MISGEVRVSRTTDGSEKEGGKKEGNKKMNGGRSHLYRSARRTNGAG